jgi:hypothetical protein
MLFDDVSKWAYKAIRQGWPKYEQWHKAVLARTEMLNYKFADPLDHSEYKHIAKSISRWTHAKFSKAGFAGWQSNNGKRSGVARTKKSEDKRELAIKMRVEGISHQAIADHFAISKSTAIRWLKTV